MGNLVYPALPGLLFPQGRAVLPPKVRIRTTPSQREYRSRDALLPRYQYSLAYEFLRTGRRGSELATLVGFYNQVGGPFDSWLYLDPDDNSVSGQQFGLGDGTSTAWQLVRSFGGFAEPVTDIAGTPLVYVADGSWQAAMPLRPGARTNLLVRSAALDDGAWNKTGSSITANAATAPDGTATADKLAESATTALHVVSQSYVMSATTYVASILAKAAERSRLVLFKNNAGGNFARGFDLATGSTFANASGYSEPLSYGMQDMGGGWYRCWIELSSTGGSASVGAWLNNGSSDTYAGTAGNGLYLWGAQLETASAPTRYIPTAAAAVTVTDFTVGSAGACTFAAAPAAGAALIWSGSYYRRCRFLGDRLDTEKFMADLFASKRVEFISVKGES